MKHLHTFESFINENLNEAAKVSLKDVQKLYKEYVDRSKYIGDLKKKSWWAASDNIILTDSDFSVSGKSVSGKYMLLGLYQLFGPEYKIEWTAVRPDMVAVFSKEIDKRTWERLLKAHQRQMVDPNNLTPSDINRAGNLMVQFLTDEINAAFPPKPVKGQFDPANSDSIKMEIESAHRDAEVSIVNNGVVRVDFYRKSAGDGRNVAKTNLLFLIDPTNSESIKMEVESAHRDAEVSILSSGVVRVDFYRKGAGDGRNVAKTNLLFLIDLNRQTVEFKNPSSSKFLEVKYTSLRDLSNFFKDSIKGWEDEEKRKLAAMQQNAFSQDR